VTSSTATAQHELDPDEEELETEDEETETGSVPAQRIVRSPFIRLPPCNLCVISWKGGVAKTTLAYELAYLFGGRLVDWDWDKGGATKAWGRRVEKFVKAPLLDAIETGRTPRPLRGALKPDLIPSHPDLGTNMPEAEKVAESLELWVGESGETHISDTHPGGNPAAYGAMSVSRLVIVPAVLKTKELDALEGMLEEIPDYPLLIVPMMVPPAPPAAEFARFKAMCRSVDAPVSPMISRYDWIGTRKIRRALTSYDEPEPARIKLVATQLRSVAKAVSELVGN
jgi:chromosome partitioning protein